MKNQVCWTERMEEGVQREVRVTFFGDRLKWQTKRSDEDQWDYSTPSTPEDWDELVKRVENRYQRRAVPFKDLELVRRLRPPPAKEN